MLSLTFVMLVLDPVQLAAFKVPNFENFALDFVSLPLTLQFLSLKCALDTYCGALVAHFGSMTGLDLPKNGSQWPCYAVAPALLWPCLLYTSPSPRDKRQSRMPSSA